MLWESWFVFGSFSIIFCIRPCSASYSFCISIGDPVYGCTDPEASNFNPDANTDDGSCIYEGCTDENACNYDSSAIVNDGSCEYVVSQNIMLSQGWSLVSTYIDPVTNELNEIFSDVVNDLVIIKDEDGAV